MRKMKGLTFSIIIELFFQNIMKKILFVLILLFSFIPFNGANNLQKYVDSKGIWIWGSTLYDIDGFVDEMVKHNFSDVYLLVKDVTGYYTFDLINDLLTKSNGRFRVHAWIICFMDYSKGGWVDVNSTMYRQYLINDIIVPLVTF